MKRLFAAFCMALLVGVTMSAGSSNASAAQTKEIVSSIGVDVGNDVISHSFVANDNHESMPAYPVADMERTVMIAEIVYPVYPNYRWFATSNSLLCGNNNLFYSLNKTNSKSTSHSRSGMHRFSHSK